MDTGQFVGRVGLRHWEVEGHLEIELLYTLLSQFWGQGLATEAAREALDIGLRRLRLPTILAFTLRPQLLPAIGDLLKTIRPVANATFFNVVVVVLALVYAAVFISVRFDYWEVRPNELLHHHGFLSGLKRYAAPNLRIDKEINDVFEYMLLGSGRLILRPAGEREARRRFPDPSGSENGERCSCRPFAVACRQSAAVGGRRW